MSEWYERPQPSSELNKLEIFTGVWTSVDKHQPMPWMKDGGKGTTKEIFKYKQNVIYPQTLAAIFIRRN